VTPARGATAAWIRAQLGDLLRERWARMVVADLNAALAHAAEPYGTADNKCWLRHVGASDAWRTARDAFAIAHGREIVGDTAFEHAALRDARLLPRRTRRPAPLLEPRRTRTGGYHRGNEWHPFGCVCPRCAP
jgi:hypothetical protein